MFTWKPIYRELAETLMGYSTRQDELLAMIKGMQQQGLPVISLKDKSANAAEIDLAAIDPFTFFSNFNRGITEDSRRKMLTFLKERFGLSSPVERGENVGFGVISSYVRNYTAGVTHKLRPGKAA